METNIKNVENYTFNDMFTYEYSEVDLDVVIYKKVTLLVSIHPFHKHMKIGSTFGQVWLNHRKGTFEFYPMDEDGISYKVYIGSLDLME